MTAARLLCAFGLSGAILSSAGAARADDADEDGRPDTTLTGALKSTQFGCRLDAWRVRPFGWVEGMLTTSPLTDADTRAGRVFDVEAEGFRLHQAYLGVERLPATECCADVGGKVALYWGTDARFTHARGLMDDQDGREQWDLLEAHALVRLPVAEGLTFKIGKCTTPMGFEVIEAANNLLPSRSFLFGYAIPYTHTGVIATLQTSAQTSVSYGLVLGWDVWDDNNDALTSLFTYAWKSPSERDSITVNAVVGAEQPDDDHDLRAVVDATWARTWNECWKTALNVDVGHEQGATASGGDATWWGAAGYLTRTFSDALSGTVRAEVFRDEDGTRLGVAQTLSEVTLGLDWTPWHCLPSLHVRPEVRWDHSYDGAFFDDGRDDDQVSLTLDLVFTF